MNAGFFRRSFAALYDWLLVLALMMVLSVPLVALLGDAIDPGNLLYRGLLLGIAALFFCGFWVRGGQTLGMRAWRIRLYRDDGQAVDLRTALLRLAAACLSLLPAALGFLWVWIDREGLSWHDRMSRTRLVRVEKNPAGGSAHPA